MYKAFTYNREAAKKAHGRSAYTAAIERFEDALTALDHLPDDEVHLADKMDIRFEMRTIQGGQIHLIVAPCVFKRVGST